MLAAWAASRRARSHSPRRRVRVPDSCEARASNTAAHAHSLSLVRQCPRVGRHPPHVLAIVALGDARRVTDWPCAVTLTVAPRGGRHDCTPARRRPPFPVPLLPDRTRHRLHPPDRRTARRRKLPPRRHPPRSPSPGVAPMTFDERVQALQPLGLTPRQTRFLVTVALHSGFCVRRQYAAFARIRYGASCGSSSTRWSAASWPPASPTGATAASCTTCRAAALPGDRAGGQPEPPRDQSGTHRPQADAAGPGHQRTAGGVVCDRGREGGPVHGALPGPDGPRCRSGGMSAPGKTPGRRPGTSSTSCRSSWPATRRSRTSSGSRPTCARRGARRSSATMRRCWPACRRGRSSRSPPPRPRT
jgi:hypothetical protein